MLFRCGWFSGPWGSDLSALEDFGVDLRDGGSQFLFLLGNENRGGSESWFISWLEKVDSRLEPMTHTGLIVDDVPLQFPSVLRDRDFARRWRQALSDTFGDG